MKVSCRNKIFDTYSQVEAEKKGIKYLVDWRKANKGDWILADDGKVLEVLGRRKHSSKSKKPIYLIRTGFGETPTYRKKIFAQSAWDYDRDKYDRSIKFKVKPTTLQMAFINCLVENYEIGQNGLWKPSELIEAYLHTYQDNNPNQALKRALWILKKDTVKEKLSLLLKDKLEKVGINDEYVAEKLKEFIEDPEAPHSVRLTALGKASDLLGHNAKTQEQRTDTVFMLSDTERKKLQIQRTKLLKNDGKEIAES